jgi:antirestriction protein ArdC
MNAYETITASIVEAIEAGAGPYKMPWHTVAGVANSPINLISRKAYRGINTLVLGSAAMSKGYHSGEWATYKQWQERGAQVRKGEKSTPVVFWKFFDQGRKPGEATEGDPGGSEKKAVSIPMARLYSVFNAAQTDGYVAPPEPVINREARIADCEAFVQALGASVQHGGNRAFYSPAADTVTMPPFERFIDSTAYYSVLAHELTHWTGPRLERNLTGRFGSESYAVEELVAELGAAFTCARLGIATEPRRDHAPYIASWLRVLKGDSRAIFTAASQAQRACDWMADRASGTAASPEVDVDVDIAA